MPLRLESYSVIDCFEDRFCGRVAVVKTFGAKVLSGCDRIVELLGEAHLNRTNPAVITTAKGGTSPRCLLS